MDKAGSSPGLGPDTTTPTSCEPTLPASSDRASLPGEERTLAARTSDLATMEHANLRATNAALHAGTQ